MKLGLYIHVPFCRAKCAYCDFYSLPGRETDMDAYTDALCRQLDAFSPDAREYSVDTVYIGGGTPSYLGAARLVRILERVRRAYRVEQGAEITLEANPDSVGTWFKELYRAGYNRVSLGMQSADDAELKAVGRVHSAAQTAQAVDTVRRAGFDNLSLDLIYGLPGQSAASWRHSVGTAVSYAPEHISCYGLKVERGTPLYVRRDALSLPDDDAQADCYLWAVDALSGHGFGQYEISNFARPGRASRHNLKYWTLGAYMGFGTGAHSDFAGVRYAWARDLRGFITSGWTRTDAVRVSERERRREWLMLGLRTTTGLSETDCQCRFGRSLDAFTPFFERCMGAGYAVRRPGGFALTPQGFLVSNQIIGQVLELAEEHDF